MASLAETLDFVIPATPRAPPDARRHHHLAVFRVTAWRYHGRKAGGPAPTVTHQHSHQIVRISVIAKCDHAGLRRDRKHAPYPDVQGADRGHVAKLNMNHMLGPVENV